MKKWLALISALPLLAFAAPQEKIVTLGGDVTEIVYALGASSSLVARDSTSQWPQAANVLPDVGYLRQLNAEGILSMRPTLVLASAQAQREVAEQVQLQIRQQETNVEARERQVDQAKAQLETANLNLSYTEVRAPFDGFVTKRNVQPGTLVQAGTALFSLVSPNVWVVANFKESQLERMKPGDKVEVSVDAWPDMALEGHVDSIQQGSGSRFSAFPSENATGNFVKIVQRVPVKIVIDKGLDPNKPLPLGLSVEPKVTVE